MSDRTLDLHSRGLRGESYASLARRTGAFGAAAGDSDSTVLTKMFDDLSANVQGVNNFRATFAEAVADFAVGEYFTTAESGSLRIYKRTGTSPFYVDQGDDAAPVTRTEAQLIKGARVNLLAYGAVPSDESAAADNVIALNAAISDVYAAGGGYVEITDDFALGGPWVNYGTFTYQAGGTVPFKRGLIRMRSGVHIVGHGGSRGAGAPRLFFAAGHTDTGGMFYSPFWLGDGQVDGFTIEGVDLDGNYENQTFTQYAAANTDAGLWMHGHGVYCGSVRNLTVRNCKIHGFWGHGVFGWSGDDKITDDFLLEENDIYDNLQGGMQGALNRFRSVRNYYHGHFGWTGVGFNIETARADEESVNILSLCDTIDARDGLSTPYATIRDWDGYEGVATDSAEAAAYRIQRRRGIMLSGDYYENSPPTGQRARVKIIGVQCFEASVCSAGFEGVTIEGTFEDTYQADIRRYWPPVNNLVTVTHGGLDTFYDQCTVNAQIRTDGTLPAIAVRKFKQARITADVIGGRSAPCRLEDVGGVVTINGRDFGTAASGSLTDNTGSTSSAVVAYGASGPLDITVHAVETRSGAARQVQYATYLNVSAAWPVMVKGSATGALLGTVRDINGAAINLGVIDSATRKLDINVPVILRNTLETHGTVDHISDSGELNVNLRSPDATGRKLNFMTAGGLQFQISQLSDGGVLFQQFDDGTFERQPMRFDENGVLAINATYTSPLQTTSGWLWVSASGVLRINATKPTADSDGVAVGSQS